MKKFYSFFLVASLSFAVVGCSNEEEIFADNIEEVGDVEVRSIFPEADNSTELKGTPNNKVKYLLTNVGPEFAKGLSPKMNIESYQISEIKTFTDELVAECTTEKEKFYAIYNYVGSEIKYASEGYVDNDPYPVFLTKSAVCQGYANLLKVMCYTQDIPAVVVNGNLFHGGMFYGAHAWNYVYADGQWYVCDPTNKSTVGGGPYLMNNYSSYNSNLVVASIDAVLFEDDNFTYTYTNEMINVHSVKSDSEQVVVPYSINGYMITSFNPEVKFPNEVTELVLGSNIQTLGRVDYIIGINHYANNVSSIQIDPANEYYESFCNVVYGKEAGVATTLVSIAPAAISIELKPLVAFGKDNAIKYHNCLEEIVFVPGTEYIDDYSVEFCPNLRTAYIPESTQVSERAFDEVASDFKIVRGDYTNIPQIKED